MTIVQPTTTSPPETAPTGWAPTGWVIGVIAAVIVVAGIVGSAGQKDTTVTSDDGVMATTNATGPPSAATSGDSVATWATLYGGPDSEKLGDDMDAMASAATRNDLAAMVSSCRTFQRHIASAEANLPTPNAALTSELATAYRYLDQAATACITGESDVDMASIGRSSSYLELGAESIARAAAILKTLS